MPLDKKMSNVIRVKVSQLDIDLFLSKLVKKTKTLTDICPIAQSLLRVGHKEVFVHRTYTTIDTVKYHHSQKTIKFLKDFDSGLIKPSNLVLRKQEK